MHYKTAYTYDKNTSENSTVPFKDIAQGIARDVGYAAIET